MNREEHDKAVEELAELMSKPEDSLARIERARMDYLAAIIELWEEENVNPTPTGE